MNPCVITCGIGHWYPRGVARLASSIYQQNTETSVLAWMNTLPPGSEPYASCPYTVKPFCFRHAMDRGFDVVVWADCSTIAISPLDPIFEHIDRNGYFFNDNGFRCGTWCSDAAVNYFSIGREESFEIPEVTTMVVGLDLRRRESRSFLDEWEAAAKAGVFQGAHTNDVALEEAQRIGVAQRDIGPVSIDPRVYGHRHDQSAASILCWRRGWKGIPRPKFVDYWTETPDPRVAFLSRGM